MTPHSSGSPKPPCQGYRGHSEYKSLCLVPTKELPLRPAKGRSSRAQAFQNFKLSASPGQSQHLEPSA